MTFRLSPRVTRKAEFFIFESLVTFRASPSGVRSSCGPARSKPDKTSAHESSKANLGKRIIALRTSLKIGQLELGKRVGTSAKPISKWESTFIGPG